MKARNRPRRIPLWPKKQALLIIFNSRIRPILRPDRSTHHTQTQRPDKPTTAFLSLFENQRPNWAQTQTRMISSSYIQRWSPIQNWRCTQTLHGRNEGVEPRIQNEDVKNPQEKKKVVSLNWISRFLKWLERDSFSQAGFVLECVRIRVKYPSTTGSCESAEPQNRSLAYVPSH